MVALLAAACGAGSTPAPDPLAGVYSIGGSDAALPVVQALADAFAAKHPGVKFTYDTSLGSDGGANDRSCYSETEEMLSTNGFNTRAAD